MPVLPARNAVVSRAGAILVVLGSLAALGTVACSGHKAVPVAAADAGPAIGSLSAEQAAQVLVRVGEHAITLGDYAAALEHMDAFDRLRYSAPARRRELLGEMVDVLLLADEARSKGYDKDPVTAQELREILRDAILKKAREGAPTPNDVPAPEVAAYYDAHRGDFRDPERRRVSAIVLRSEPAAAAVLEPAIHASAEAWGELVRAKSIEPGSQTADAPIDLAGDLGFVSPPGDLRGLNPRIPEEVRAATFTLEKVGDVLPRVVSAGARFYVIKLAGKVDAHERSLGDVERVVRVKLAQDKARAAEETLLDELRKQFPVEIDQAALAQVHVELPGDGGTR